MPGAEEQAAPEVFAVVTSEVIDRAAIEAFVLSRRDGALVTFEGVIRDHDHGEPVTALDYSAHPDAERFLRDTCAEVARETGLAIAAGHRVGPLAIGDVALVASVAAPHRAEAFAACALLVDRIKERTPIWKRQHLEGGTSEWVNL
ncbi:molybdenum cofactor biosynthesis protein MoaE [Agromyces marinus]|uniref:Molybdenum cofactor biosynthesis protein MoaE n=1 Tax=Agromyces marinus TaxID=1389020 RepID=A0ABM8H327_9MICO|nr:molybdenum cofactor biosynthesis protein MoaE [Agromyces marinus]UIP59745.1 Molybdopterin synthase catalytic subunit 2 [Agromyces marinus]BDZ55176.1 molybdenum cofactor biosynthesis protein MoaE [Agromyces marinus]